MTPEERKMERQMRRDRHAVALREPLREQQETIPSHTQPQPSNDSTCEIDHPDVVQRMQNFHRSLLNLQNVFCDLRKECFPTIKTDELGICYCCQSDSHQPKLFTVQNNMDPGSVPTELYVSSL